MLKGLSLIALVMAISVDARNLRPNGYYPKEEPYTVVFQFQNYASQRGTVFGIFTSAGSIWNEELEEIVASYGGSTQGQLTGPEDGAEAAGLFQVRYPSGDIVLVVAGIGGDVKDPVCLAMVNEYDSGSLAISYESDITGRTLTCIAKATNAQTV
ncbi:hypothetical protein EMCRGX_G000098 [Ephydatia muelleri]|eukprot:Em0001g30a